MPRRINTAALLLLLTNCAYDCEHRGLRFTNTTNHELSCVELQAATECWVSVVSMWEAEANEVVDRELFVTWLDELEWRGKRMNGLSWTEVGAMKVKRSHEEVAQTAYFHELGHFLHARLYGHNDAAHANKEFWQIAESKAKALCTPEVRKYLGK